MNKNTLSLSTEPLGNELPLYKEIKMRISTALHQNKWMPGQAIPSEKQMQKLFKVSIGTVRKAVDELVSENVLVRYQGRGTYVASHNSHRYFFTFFRIHHTDGHREIPRVELLKFEQRKADFEVAQALAIGVSESVYCFTNLLYMGNQPTIVDEITIPVDLFPHLTEKMLAQRTNTIYSFYQESYGISVVHTADQARAMPAKQPYRGILKLTTNDALLVLNRIAFTYRSKPVELRKSYVNTNNYEYDAENVYGR